MAPGATRRLLAASLAVLLASCSATPASVSPGQSSTPLETVSLAPEPSASAVPTTLPSSTPAATPAPVETPVRPADNIQYPSELDFANEFAMRVAVTGLNVRAKPSTSGAKRGKAPKGSVFLVRDWPVRANGYTWYFGYMALLPRDLSIPALPEPLGAGIDPLAGWLAAGTSTNPYLLPVG